MLTPWMRAKLVLMRESPNDSTRPEAVERYVEELMRGTQDVRTLQDLVQRTNNIELMQRFSALVPGADAEELHGLIATAQVIDA